MRRSAFVAFPTLSAFRRAAIAPAALAWSLALVAVFGAPQPARADPAADSRAVIERQLDAFQRDDWDEAFEYASPGIQSIFRNPDRFGEMVRNGYPMVWRPSSVDFLGAVDQGGWIEQRLQIVDGAGEMFIARYRLEQVDGAWRIAGVWIERAPASV